MQVALYSTIGLAAASWLWFLARGRSSGALKRAGLRLSLVAFTAGLLALAARRGLLQHASLGFRLALLLALLGVCVGYLYLIRFCGACGRMVRNLREPSCPRCGGPLPLHGMTSRLRATEEQRHRPSLVKPPGSPLRGPRA